MAQDEIDEILDELRRTLRRLRRAVDNYPRFSNVGEPHEELRQAVEEYRRAHRRYEDAAGRLLRYEQEQDA